MSDFVTAQDKAMRAGPLGLYVHVPFCARTCDYCAFYQTTPTAESVRRYLDGIAAEAQLTPRTQPVETMFWGGGTPGLLAARDLQRLGEIALAWCGAPPVEWTVEMTPVAATTARLEVLKALGVTRISMGVQSFQPDLLEALGRPHSRDQVYRAYERVRAAGFASVNLDLMFALPGQSDEAWAAEVREAVALAPDHLSTYCLTFEEDTKLWVKLSQGKLRRDVEAEARLYLATWAQLAAAGYAQYEVANFARSGHCCRHNLNTWRMQQWVGFGPSAASQYAGWRCANVSDLDAWLAHAAQGRRATEDRVPLTPELLAEDALIFGLRMNEGVDVAQWRQSAPAAPWAEVEALLARLATDGLLTRTGSTVALTDRGRLVADSVGAELMTAFAPEKGDSPP